MVSPNPDISKTAASLGVAVPRSMRQESRGQRLAKETIKAVVPHSWIHAVLRRRKTPIGTQLQSVNAPAGANSEVFLRRFDFAWLLDTLAELEDPPRFFYTNERGLKPSICFLQQNMKRMVDALTEIISRYGLVASAVVDGKMQRLHTYEELLYTVASDKITEMKLAFNLSELNFRLEAWVIRGNTVVAPRANVFARNIYLTPDTGAADFLQSSGKHLSELFDNSHESLFDAPIDVVYTWVDGSDPNWQKLYIDHALPLLRKRDKSKESLTAAITENPEIFDRYASRDELKFSLRSIDRFMPWVRNIVIVSNCAPPPWLDTDNPRVRWVDHSEILDPDHLPTFNSHAIESAIHKIPGISEHFIYFNDDLFALRPLDPLEFFTSNGLSRIRLEPYGFVHGEIDGDDPDYLNAARNVQSLLSARFGKTVTQLHTHTPAPIKASVLKQAEADFPDDYRRTRENKLRSPTDISPTSFLSPHYHFLSGNAIHQNPNYKLVKKTAPYKKLFDTYLQGLRSGTSKLPALICINDGGGSTSDEDWNAAVSQFMEAAFPLPSEFEKSSW